MTTKWELRLMRYLLAGGDQMTMAELCKGIPTYSPAIYRVRLVNGLVDKGWIRRRADVLEATAKGCLAVKEAADSAVLEL